MSLSFVRAIFKGFGFLVLTACAPPGYSDLMFTAVTWPQSDQGLSIEDRLEVEGRLRALNYLKEPADGVITVNTRSAIRTFQRDIGAPVSGFLSIPLLDALRTNSAFLTPNELKAVRQGVVVDPTAARLPRPSALAPLQAGASASGGAEADGGNPGGTGGAGSGGAWN